MFASRMTPTHSRTGGSPVTARPAVRRAARAHRAVVVVVASAGGRVNAAAVETEEKLAFVEEARASSSNAVSVSTSQSGSKKVIDEGMLLTSTWEHRAWVWSTSATLGLTFLKGLSEVHTTDDALAVGLGLASAYFLADFGTGVYHWAVDNYGSGETPIVGGQIAAFQGHHVRPWTITQREFCNNVHQVFRPALAPAMLLFLTSDLGSPTWNTSASFFVFLACMSQQFHAWSHMKKSELPEYIVNLQDAGLLISRKAHGAHHRAPFEGNYCIVSGFWNPFLDQNGADDAFFRQLERYVADRTGVEPRCWYEPQYEWMPQEDITE